MEISIPLEKTNTYSRSLEPISVLVAEDDPGFAKQLSYILKGLNYSIIDIVNSGEEMIYKLSYLKPDLLLMDIELGGKIDGIDTLKKIRTFSNIPAIYISTLSDAKTINRAKLTNPASYLTKPLNPVDLHLAIEIAVNNHKGKY